MIGIYKITSPFNKIYIGQSINLKTRFRKYKYLNCKQQFHLYNSFIKYGFENHTFEIIEECSLEQLDEREIYWGKFYDVLGPKGLNCRLGNGRGSCSEETKKKIGKGNQNKIISKEARNNISKALKGRKVTWDTPGPKGYKHSEEAKQKMRKPRINKWEREKLVSEIIVTEIREKYSTGNYSKSNLSREYNISWGTVKNIVDRINSYK